jgi:hypothetical protein
MMRGAFNEKMEEQAAMYALGMLSGSEASRLERCLNDEPEDYAEEIAIFEAVVAELALGAPERTPSEKTRKLLLTTIAGDCERSQKHH